MKYQVDIVVRVLNATNGHVSTHELTLATREWEMFKLVAGIKLLAEQAENEHERENHV